MTYRITPLIFAYLLLPLCALKAQTKIIGECTLKYVIKQLNTEDTIGFKSVYVKGDQCKTTLQTPHLTQTLLFNVQQSTATITKDIGSTHFLQSVIYPPVAQPNLISMKEFATDSVVKILGYNCKRVELKWSDGVVYQILYTTDIATTVNTFELAFKEVAGLVLSYTIYPISGQAIQYQATKIDLSPISLSQFNINKDLYQIID